MYRSQQPLTHNPSPVLQETWQHSRYEQHRSKVKTALPVVDTKGFQTPAHVQLKLKQRQIEEDRLSIIQRDNQLLASRLADIMRSKGLLDNWNHFTPERSLNAVRRREQLLLVTQQNLAILQRLQCCQSQYKRQYWDNWERIESLRNNISRYSRGVTNQQPKRVKSDKTSEDRKQQ